MNAHPTTQREADERAVIERAIRFIETGSHSIIARDTMTNELRKLLSARASLTPTAPAEQVASKALRLMQNAARAWNNENEPALDAAMETIECFLLDQRKAIATPTAPQAVTTASADDSEFLAMPQGAAKEATDEWVAGFVRQHFGIYAATTASASERDALADGLRVLLLGMGKELSAETLTNMADALLSKIGRAPVQAAHPALPAEPIGFISKDAVRELQSGRATITCISDVEIIDNNQPIYLAAPGAAQTAGEPDRFTLDELADACVSAEVPDSKYETLCIALQERAALK